MSSINSKPLISDPQKLNNPKAVSLHYVAHFFRQELVVCWSTSGMSPLNVGNVPTQSLISFNDEGRAGDGCVLEYFGKCPHLMSEMFPLNH